MNNKLAITSLSEWLALPKIEPFPISSPAEKGNVYEVYKAGFFMADKIECNRYSVKVDTAFQGKCVLPTAVIVFNGEKQLVSLPFELSEWVQSCVGLARMGSNPFPTNVEFGVLNGRPYAEML